MDSQGDYAIILKADAAKRYNVKPVTIERWVAAREKTGFPKPIVINRRMYFRLDQLQDYDRTNADQAAAL